jgi:hypothetical protein
MPCPNGPNRKPPPPFIAPHVNQPKNLRETQLEVDLATIQTLALALQQVVRRAELTHTFERDDKQRFMTVLAATNALAQRVQDGENPSDGWVATDLADMARLFTVSPLEMHTAIASQARFTVAVGYEQNGIPNQVLRAHETNQQIALERGLPYNPADFTV